jgi:hypothetical protein
MRAALRVKLKLRSRENGLDDREGRVEIAAWLRGLGLEQYEPAIRDNGIDAEVLPKLTAEDLNRVSVSRGAAGSETGFRLRARRHNRVRREPTGCEAAAPYPGLDWASNKKVDHVSH